MCPPMPQVPSASISRLWPRLSGRCQKKGTRALMTKVLVRPVMKLLVAELSVRETMRVSNW
ncbi:hypothetical protein D3C86_2037690 [compost metagenome]